MSGVEKTTAQKVCFRFEHFTKVHEIMAVSLEAAALHGRMSETSKAPAIAEFTPVCRVVRPADNLHRLNNHFHRHRAEQSWKQETYF